MAAGPCATTAGRRQSSGREPRAIRRPSQAGCESRVWCHDSSVIAFSGSRSAWAAILGGILVFDEPIGSGPLEMGARLIAFCLVIAGAALMPIHAEQLEPDENPTRNAKKARVCGPSPYD
jgi:hypothetical protein